MKRFRSGTERPLPRPGPFGPPGPPGPPRRPPPPPEPRPAPSAALRRPGSLLCDARRASARPPYGRSSSPAPYESEGDPVAARGAARRPEGADWPRRAAARPPSCGCGSLRRCSLIERLLLGQAHLCAPGNGGWFPVPPSTDAVVFAFTRTAPRTGTSSGVTWFPVVCMPHRLRTVKTHRGPKFTPNQATCFLRIGDVTPFTLPPLVACGGAIYRHDVSSRYISSA